LTEARRQLKAIMFTDVVGYSRMMGENESLAIERIKHHHQFVRTLLSGYKGKEQDSAGDGFLLLFDSALEALEYAVALQKGQQRENRKTPDLPPIKLRIGIHLGDIVVEGDAAYGEGLNLAARVEPLAEPGGICITQEVHSQVRHKTDLPIQSIGHRELKNISHAPELFRIELEKRAPEKKSGPSWLLLSVLGIAAVVGLALLLAFLENGTSSTPSNARRTPTISPKKETASTSKTVKRRGGVLTMVYEDQLGTFDPFSIIGKPSRRVLDFVMERLGDLRGGRVIWGPIESIKENPEGDRLELMLKKGIFFHRHPCFNTGKSREATPQDVAFSITQMAKSGLLRLPIKGLGDFKSGKTKTLSGTYVGKDRNVVVELDSPLPYVPEFLASIPLLPRALEGCEDIRNLKQPVGTGPFRWHRQDAESVSLRRFPEYWGKDENGEALPYLEGLEWRYIPDEAAAISALGRGKVHLHGLSWKQRVRYLVDANSSHPQLKEEFRRLNAEPIVRNTRRLADLFSLLPLFAPKNPLNNRLLRKAISHGTDRIALTKTVPRKVLPLGRFLSPRMHGYDPSIKNTVHDRTLALKYLAEAGFKKGRGLRPLRMATASDLKKTFGVWTEQMASIGIRIESVDLSTSGLEQAIKTRNVDAFWGRFNSMLMGHDPYYLFLTAAQVCRKFGYENTKMYAAMERMSEEIQLDKRKLHYAKLERLFLDDPPLVPFYTYSSESPRTVLLVSKKVKNLYDPMTNRLIDQRVRLERVYFAE
jgi:ABC-type transport system substrate-binding protein/class 3 adenylate cyclase